MTAAGLVVDSSVWIEFFMATGSAADHRLTDAIGNGDPLVIPEIVRLELLIGDPAEAWAEERRSFVDRFDVVALEPIVDTEAAAALHRTCRRGGETVRRLFDCLVAATAIRLDLPVLHRDRDFEVMARHTALRTESMF